MIDLENMVQFRRNDPGRRRKIKRDMAGIPTKGVAGIRLSEGDGRGARSLMDQAVQDLTNDGGDRGTTNPAAQPVDPRVATNPQPVPFQAATGVQRVPINLQPVQVQSRVDTNVAPAGQGVQFQAPTVDPRVATNLAAQTVQNQADPRLRVGTLPVDARLMAPSQPVPIIPAPLDDRLRVATAPIQPVLAFPRLHFGPQQLPPNLPMFRTVNQHVQDAQNVRVASPPFSQNARVATEDQSGVHLEGGNLRRRRNRQGEQTLDSRELIDALEDLSLDRSS